MMNEIEASSDRASGSSSLSLERIREAAVVIDPVFRDSPQFISETLSRRLGMRLLCKVECLNPIRSFKGRGTDYFVHGLGSDSRPLVAASAGNFGQGMAHAARKRGRPVILFAAITANPLKIQMMRSLGADVRLQGAEFDAAKDAARSFAQANNFRYVEDGREPAIAEGAGTIALELGRWPEPIDVVLVPVGNGALINGIGRWLKAFSPQCRIIGVCAVRAPSMAESWRQAKVIETATADTIADGIAVRVPVAPAVAEMARTVDDIVLVSEERLVAAMQLLHQELGLVVEPAGATGVAAALDLTDRLAGQLVATPICGSNVTAEQARAWLI
jgi:threonine dehydratase